MYQHSGNCQFFLFYHLVEFASTTQVLCAASPGRKRFRQTMSQWNPTGTHNFLTNLFLLTLCNCNQAKIFIFQSWDGRAEMQIHIR